MTTGLIPGEQPPDPRPTGDLPQQRREPGGHGVLHVDDRSRSSVITARAAASFEPVGRSVASARSFVRDTLQGWGFADIVDDAVVLTSELVTNAVRYGSPPVELRLIRDRGLTCEIRDASITAPYMKYAGAVDEGGAPRPQEAAQREGAS